MTVCNIWSWMYVAICLWRIVILLFRNRSILVSDVLWADDTFAQKRQNEKEMRSIENNLRHNLQHLWTIFAYFTSFFQLVCVLAGCWYCFRVQSSRCHFVQLLRTLGSWQYPLDILLIWPIVSSIFSFLLQSVAFGYSDCYVMCTQFWLCHKSTKTSKWSSNRITMPWMRNGRYGSK